MRIAFDVDGTLIKKDWEGRDIPRHDIIQLLLWFAKHDHDVIIWSGGGIDYAKQWAEKLGLGQYVRILSKDEYHDVDLCFDDEATSLARLDIRV